MIDSPGSDIAVPLPTLTPMEMVQSAAAMRGLLRERQAETEGANRILSDVHERCLAAGFYRLLQPRRFGGYEFDLPTFADVVIELARGCPSTGWVVAFTAGHVHVLAKYPERVQAEVYGSSGDCCAPLVEGQINSTARPVEGGYVVDGTFDNSSGIDVATHFFGFSRVDETDGPGPQHQILALFDRDQFEIEHNWDMLGMRGTGSHRTAVHGQFVTDDRAPSALDVLSSVTPVTDRVLSNPMYVGPSFNVLMTEIAGVALGTGYCALDLYEDVIRRHKVPRAETLRIDDREYQLYYGQAFALLETARASLRGVARQFMEACEREVINPGSFTTEESWRVGLVTQQCVRMAGDATSILFRTSGSSPFKPGTPINRCFRDMSTLLTHVTLSYDRWAERAARLHFGFE